MDQFSMRSQISTQTASQLAQASSIQQYINAPTQAAQTAYQTALATAKVTNPDINSKDPEIARMATQKALDSAYAYAQANGISMKYSE